MTTLKNIASALTLTTVASFAEAAETTSPTTQVLHRTVKIDGLDIFYREAGPKDAPTILLLHGFPTSSHMFRNLIPTLADKCHVVAPDYPGFLERRRTTMQRLNSVNPEVAAGRTKELLDTVVE